MDFRTAYDELLKVINERVAELLKELTEGQEKIEEHEDEKE